VLIFIHGKMKKKEIGIRCWIDINGAKFFGPGRAELLELIEEAGSISKAAKKMGMSYKKAWDMVHHMNSNSKRPFVISKKGGENGGGAEITETARQVVYRYRILTDKLRAVIKKDSDLLKLI